MSFRSIGGGTGSGLGSLILEKLRDDFIKIPNFDFTITPSPNISTAVVEPYNSLLALNEMIENNDISIMLDNQAMYRICENKLDIELPGYSNLNKMISQVFSSLTSSLRFPGALNTDLTDF